MSAIPISKLKFVKRLYYERLLSAKQIAKKLDVSLDAVYYFMRHYNLPRRSFAEDNRLRFAKKTPSFRIKKQLSRYDLELKIAGTVLYWGEGYKSEKAVSVDFANSDPRMISVFVNFLRRICCIKEDRLRVLLYCYANQNIKKLVNFWSRVTGVPKNQFSKPYIRDDFCREKVNRMPYGLIHVRYSDKKLLLLIKQWIEYYQNIFLSAGT